MKVLLIDMAGYCLDLALRAQCAGHEVRVFMGPEKHTGERLHVGDGLIRKVVHWEDSMHWADLVFVADNSKYLHNLEAFRKQGYPIFGACKETASWELDRAVGQKIFEEAGIETIPSQSFRKYQEARNYVTSTMGRYVSKPNGDVCKALSYVSKSPKDMCYMLDKWHKEGGITDEFILQEFVPGIEFAVGAFFGPNGFTEYVMENFEHKKLMTGEKGCNTEEMGTVLKYTKDSELARQVLYPLEGALYRAGHTGYIDVSVIIGTHGAYKGKPMPMEFTARPGWPLEIIRQALEMSDPMQWMLDLLDGKDNFHPSEKVAVGVVVGTFPDFTFETATANNNLGTPVYGVTEKNISDIHFVQCMLGKAPEEINGEVVEEEMVVTAGAYVYVATGTDKTVSGAAKKAYKVIDEIELPNSPGYRTDIGERLEEQLPELQKLGFAMDWEF